jgi:hypothetical protein
MSLSPEPLPQPEIPADRPPESAREALRRSRRRVIVGMFFALFSFEIGLFLVVFPWMDNWDLNYFEGVFPALRDTWDDPYFRGLVTGLGLINIYIAFLQIFSLIRGPRR